MTNAMRTRTTLSGRSTPWGRKKPIMKTPMKMSATSGTPRMNSMYPVQTIRTAGRLDRLPRARRTPTREGEQDPADGEEDGEQEAAPVAPLDAAEGDDDQEREQNSGEDDERRRALESPRSVSADGVEEHADRRDGEHEQDIPEGSREPEEDGDEEYDRRKAPGSGPFRRRLRPTLRDLTATLRAEGARAVAEGGGEHEEGRPEAPELVARERADHQRREVQLDDLPVRVDEDELPDPVGGPGRGRARKRPSGRRRGRSRRGFPVSTDAAAAGARAGPRGAAAARARRSAWSLVPLQVSLLCGVQCLVGH